MVQGYGESRETLTERFRASPVSVLLGVASFWEGVDFPGEELEILVIPKLPFPVPTEPIVHARSERLRALGENPFEKLFLPEAVLRLRQGVGRLIRRKDDRGVVVILDSRIGTRPYGGAILSAMPSQTIVVCEAEAIAGESAAWFHHG
jgi:ATP-dependent DNA helicase DinG